MTVYRCVQCNLELASREEQKTHSRSDWHVHNLQRKVAGLNVLSAAEFAAKTKAITALAPPARVAVPKKVREAVEWSTPYVEGVCLFDRTRCGSAAQLLNHMRDRHSFKIPDAEYCVDVPALLRVLGRQVWEERECLWCLKRFRNTIDVQNHMHDAGHTRIGRHYQYQVDKYQPFYDFTSSIQELNLPAADGWESVVANSLQDADDEFMVVMRADDLVSSEKWRPQVLDDGSLYIPTSSKIVPHRFARPDFGEDPPAREPHKPASDNPKLPWPKWQRAQLRAL